MSFELLKNLDDTAYLKESVLNFEDFLTEDNIIITENVKKFVSWARNLLDRPIVNAPQISHDPTVSAGEASSFKVKDEKDAYAKLAKMLAGLTYFMDKNISGHDKDMLATKAETDKATSEYLKKFGVDKAKKTVDLILADIATKRRSYVRKMLDRVEEFYRIKNVS